MSKLEARLEAPTATAPKLTKEEFAALKPSALLRYALNDLKQAVASGHFKYQMRTWFDPQVGGAVDCYGCVAGAVAWQTFNARERNEWCDLQGQSRAMDDAFSNISSLLLGGTTAQGLDQEVKDICSHHKTLFWDNGKTGDDVKALFKYAEPLIRKLEAIGQ